jgi:hypothetical protein
MDREVCASIEHGFIDFLREQAFVPDHCERHIGDAITGRAQHLDVHTKLVVLALEEMLHVLRLPERERAAARGKPELLHIHHCACAPSMIC